MLCQDSITTQASLNGERDLVQLISGGDPLPEVLHKICTAVGRQVGNVVSLVLFPGIAPEQRAGWLLSQ